MDIIIFNSTNHFCLYVLHSGQAYSDYASCPPSPSSFCFLKSHSDDGSYDYKLQEVSSLRGSDPGAASLRSLG